MKKEAIRSQFDAASLSYALTMIRLADTFLFTGDTDAARRSYQQAEYALSAHLPVSHSLMRLLQRAASGKLALRSKLFPVTATALLRLDAEQKRVLQAQVLTDALELGRELHNGGKLSEAEALVVRLAEGFELRCDTNGPGYAETLMLRANICCSRGDHAGFAHWAGRAAAIFEAGMPTFS